MHYIPYESKGEGDTRREKPLTTKTYRLHPSLPLRIKLLTKVREVLLVVFYPFTHKQLALAFRMLPFEPEVLLRLPEFKL
jgi:hypothetical protein